MIDTAANFGGGSIPEYYDTILGPAQLERMAADLARRLPQRPPGDVLETACGTGIVTAQLRRRLDPGLRLVATDLAASMLDYARNKLRDAAGIEWREADAAKLPFPDASFGAVVCSLGIMFVPDKGRAFAEARRVLREGGSFIFNCWDSLEHNAHPRASNEVLTALFPGDPEMDFAKGPYGFNDLALIRRLLAENRFRETRIEKTETSVDCPSAQRFATGVLKGTPRSLLIQSRGVSLDEVIDKLAAAFARIGGAAPFRCRGQAIIVEARAL